MVRQKQADAYQRLNIHLQTWKFHYLSKEKREKKRWFLGIGLDLCHLAVHRPRTTCQCFTEYFSICLFVSSWLSVWWALVARLWWFWWTLSLSVSLFSHLLGVKEGGSVQFLHTIYRVWFFIVDAGVYLRKLKKRSTHLFLFYTSEVFVMC